MVRGTPKSPPFLQLRQSVDMRESQPDPIDRLIWVITGERRGP